MFFSWLFGRRSRLTQPAPRADEYQSLDESLWQARHLSKEQRDKLIRWVRVFLAEKNWEGCNGLTITPEMKWGIASAAGFMVLAYEDWYFDRTKTILVYPAPYLAREDGRSSLINNQLPSIMGEFPRAGQTIYQGPVVVNWQDVAPARQGANEGDHLVIHEFAHQLDLINSPFADGLPPLPDSIDETTWRKAMRAEFEEARSLVEQGHRVLMDDYGLTSESELFAVGSEYYFQQPAALETYHPTLYELLNLFYQLDLANRLPRAAA